MECCAEREVVETGYSVICVNCGTTTRSLGLDKFNLYSAPLQRSYERESRFMTKVDKLLGIITPKINDPIWELLSSYTGNLENSTQVRAILRNSTLKDKHYDCVRSFTLIFSTSEPEPEEFDPQLTRTILKNKFRNIHRRWSSCSKSFFSYDWLLRRFLTEMESPLLKFLKPKTSKRRSKKYEVMLSKLSSVR